MPDGTKRLEAGELGESFFCLLGRGLREWKAICEEIAMQKFQQCSNRQEFLEHYVRLRDTDTLLAFGYVVRSHERGEEHLPQATVVNTLYSPNNPADKMPRSSTMELPPLFVKTLEAIRMDVGRRYTALHYFGLIERRKLNQVCVALLVTEAGHVVNKRLDAAKIPALVME